MKKPSKDTMLLAISIPVVTALFALNIVADGILDNQKGKFLSKKFNDVNYWDNLCTDRKGNVVETKTEEGLDKKTSKSFIDSSGCEVRRNKNCISTKCPKPIK